MPIDGTLGGWLDGHLVLQHHGDELLRLRNSLLGREAGKGLLGGSEKGKRAKAVVFDLHLYRFVAITYLSIHLYDGHLELLRGLHVGSHDGWKGAILS